MEELKERLGLLETSVSLLTSSVASSFANLEARLELRFSNLEKNMSILAEICKNNSRDIKAFADLVDKRFALVDERFNKIENRLGTIESKLNILTNETSSNFSNVGDQLGTISEQLAKISLTTRFEEEYEDLIRFKM